ADGSTPIAGLIQASDGNLYGTTYAGGTFGYGAVYGLTTTGVLSTLHSFTGGTDGAGPFSGLVQGPGGDLYGTTYYGSGLGAGGTVFVLHLLPTIINLSPATAVSGSGPLTLTVNGTNFQNGAVVQFNGGALSTTFVSSGQLTATVPATDLVSVGIQSVTVVSPAGLVSNGAQFDVFPVVSSVTLSPTSVLGTLSSQGTVTLNGPAPAGGLSVDLARDNTTVATLPATVTVAAGNTTATFTVTTNQVSATTAVTIFASCNGVRASAVLTVQPSPISSLSLSPNPVTGGFHSTGTVTLSSPAPAGGKVINLSSANTAEATVPATVTVAATKTTANFAITTKEVTATTGVGITASLSGTQTTAVLTLHALAISSISVSPNPADAGSLVTGTLTLSSAAPTGGQKITLTSSKSTAASVPASITIPAGSSSGTFRVTTHEVTAYTVVTVSASTNGSKQSASFGVQPLLVTSLSVSPNPVAGGNPVAGTVTISNTAPAGGQAVHLNSSSASAAVPATVTVPAGASTASFTIATSVVSADVFATITASANGSKQQATLTVEPIIVSTLTLSPNPVAGGNPVTGTVTLSSPAPPGGTTVFISSGSSLANVPSTISIAAGSTSGTFAIATSVVSVDTTVSITAATSGGGQSAGLLIQAGG
ncbi:MAG TPA: choice-of-anchor tandem repeat GloVer-containing protein, partial [Chthonomonadales bacterium]|nr:choice-of-anchor tandem repeat GloVer-containing protein [Chthonomonadales bacterium]